ncbi:hypothetical protein F5Y18DRAFT_433959 [Xylariaceae sp. FL1019]|nr:hypothetical protein F5Y18DRAFT_433959 [Xylariaceae sp. FL1019]
MTKLGLALCAIVAFTAGLVRSDCEIGTKYCGYNLLTIGQDYLDDMKAALKKDHEPVDDAELLTSLYKCKDTHGKSDNLEWLETCDIKEWQICQTGGASEGDECADLMQTPNNERKKI